MSSNRAVDVSPIPRNQVVVLIDHPVNSRFAAKEAAYKAFQPERKVSWKDLEVWKHASGSPSYRLPIDFVLGKPYLRVWDNLRKTDYPLSISHEKDYVVAVVVDKPLPDIVVPVDAEVNNNSMEMRS
jgi:holo-[acyl-carrier-protein] synthase